ncbi:nitrite reductase [Desulfitobacterium hafniense]|uniref:Nitrite reductase n=1 Tax=Desulfitobacterium hafniense TaxID=49338 RepID=A0A0W1JGB6_DESHA|nr:nitrite reductase [Desulfitobacterium hafniense]KTE90669.1 nitrite reductase [Desulfitobacterium hafniense]
MSLSINEREKMIKTCEEIIARCDKPFVWEDDGIYESERAKSPFNLFLPQEQIVQELSALFETFCGAPYIYDQIKAVCHLEAEWYEYGTYGLDRDFTRVLSRYSLKPEYVEQVKAHFTKRLKELLQEQSALLKGKGFLLNKDGVHFSCRVVVPGGKMNAQQSKRVSEICTQYGSGYFYLTQRENIEIPGILLDNLNEVSQYLAEVGLSIGSTGPRPRPITTCKGAVCKFSLYDTEGYTSQLNEKIYKGYYDVTLPGKLRIITSGCFNNCSMPHVGCIGIIGKKKDQVAISLGGMAARKQFLGQEIQGLYTLDEATGIIEKAIQYYKEHGNKGERFAQMIERLGFETVEKALIG